MPARPPRRAGRPVCAVVVATVALVMCVAGCGADRHVQRQEAAVRARTCESLLERRLHRTPPVISATRWLRDTERTPKLDGRGNQAEVVPVCDRIGDALSGRSAEVRRLGERMQGLLPGSTPPAPPATTPPATTPPAPPATTPPATTPPATTPPTAGTASP